MELWRNQKIHLQKKFCDNSEYDDVLFFQTIIATIRFGRHFIFLQGKIFHQRGEGRGEVY